MRHPLNVPVRGDGGPLSAARSWALILLLVCGLVGGAGCLGKGKDGAAADSTSGSVAGSGSGSTAKSDTSKAGDGAEEPEDKEKAIKVNVQQVRRGNLVMPVYADGAIRTPQAVQIKTKVGGELLEVLVRDGDRVKAGQILARIDPREYEIALEESRYRHLQALSQMAAEADTFTTNDDAARDFTADSEQLQRLLTDGAVTRSEYRDRLLTLEMAALQDGAFREAVFEQRTGLAEARMAEERARLNLEYTAVKAPFAGVVQGLTMVKGGIVAAGTQVCTIYNNENLEALVNVLEADLGDLEVGRPVRLAVPATGDTLWTAVDVISPNLDQATRTCEVLIRFDNPRGRLRPGMFVRAEIAGVIHRDNLLVPKEAVLLRDDRPLVFKRDGDRALWLYVDTGLQNDEWVQILGVHSGGSLAPGDEVVVSDHLTLAHEARISVRKTIPPADKWDLLASPTDGAE